MGFLVADEIERLPIGTRIHGTCRVCDETIDGVVTATLLPGKGPVAAGARHLATWEHLREGRVTHAPRPLWNTVHMIAGCCGAI